MNKVVYIYALCHPVTNEIRYIGKASDLKRRLQSHLDYSRVATKRRPIVDWIMALLNKGLMPVMIKIEETTDKEWAAREMFWIKAHRETGCRLLNLTDGGESNTGYVYSQELIEVRRKARLGWQFPEKVKSAIATSLSKKVVCIDDNIIYLSMKAAVADSGVPKSTFGRRINKGELINNKTYIWYNNLHS